MLLDQVQEHSRQLDTIVAQTLTTSEEMQATLSETSRQARIVSQAAQVSVNVSKTGQSVVADTVAGMKAIQRQVEDVAQGILKLSERTKQIGEIIGAVEEIVSQSEMLAINASIQATRAGDKGAGFAVVAREMRKLAEQSSEATANISNILREIRNAADAAVRFTEEGSQGARQGMELAGRAGETIQNLSATIEEAARMASRISTSADQQAHAMNRLVKAVQTIKEASSQTSTSFQEVGL